MGAANSMIHLPMTKSALEQINCWTVAEIQSTLEILVNKIADAAPSIGFTVAPKCHRVGHFLGLLPQRNLPKNLLQRLEERNIFTSLRGGALRVSPYLFNDVADVDKFLETLDYEISRV
jgi:selenocysteine lyase/cysteine desulfurase